MSRLEFTIGKTERRQAPRHGRRLHEDGPLGPEDAGARGRLRRYRDGHRPDEDDIANFADDVAIIADKLPRHRPRQQVTTATFIDVIGKAAGGSIKPLQDLGIAVDEGAVVAAGPERHAARTTRRC